MMDAKDYIIKNGEEMKNIQQYLLDFFDKADFNEVDYYLLIKNLNDYKIGDDKQDLTIFLRLLSKISDNFHRNSNFFGKIEKIIISLQQQISKFFANFNIFNIFKSNKRVLLFLFSEKILVPDNIIYNIIISDKFKKKYYPQYFYPEFNSFYKEKLIEEIKSSNPEIFDMDSEIFNANRKSGESHHYICKLIQNDSIEEFIFHINKMNISLDSQIMPSIFETNSFLIEKQPSLIEYAAFHGSIQIFQYLLMNNIELLPNLWFYAIHGKNPDLIHLLEENHVQLPNESFIEIYKESIKCHHIDLTAYIANYYIVNNNTKNINVFHTILKYYNFNELINHIMNNSTKNVTKIENFFYYLCKYDYFKIVSFLVNYNMNINIDFQSIHLKKSNEILDCCIFFNFVPNYCFVKLNLFF